MVPRNTKMSPGSTEFECGQFPGTVVVSQPFHPPWGAEEREQSQQPARVPTGREGVPLRLELGNSSWEGT